MQGLRGSQLGLHLLEPEQVSVPVVIDPLEPLNHATPPSPLGPESTWQELFAFWSERIGAGQTNELGRLGQARLEYLVGAEGNRRWD